MSLTVRVISVLNNSDLSNSLWQEINKLLPENYLYKANKFRFWKDKQAYVLGKLLTKNILQTTTNKDLEDVQYTEFNKPYVNDTLSFNVSHSGEYVVCAYCISNTQLGIDVEQIDNRTRIEDFDLVLTASEKKKIYNSATPKSDFYTLWTLKEAVVKADGRGLNIPLQEIEILEDKIAVNEKNWYYHSLLIDNNYKCHLVADEEKIEIVMNKVTVEELVSKLLQKA
ncbi:4'-phosphopantetheinyl transferase family protein [Tenacibaculum sp. TC6]|uniref:4'-phosphopantetheinyl transferase family protein n=1 Tax=Tenacibaculum sp. TC6 TaxID=3423223 RepID=UPI003D364D3A